MKRLAFALLAILAIRVHAAHAENVTLEPSSCAYTRICPEVANDAGYKITLYAVPDYTNVYLFVDNVLYQSPTGNAVATQTAAGVRVGSIESLTLTSADGYSIVLTCSFVGLRKYISGRGAHWVTQWVLVSGVLQR